MSTNLSILTVFGLALLPLLSQGAASSSGSAEPPGASAARAIAAPVEIVRTKPVQIQQVPVPQMETALRFPWPPSETDGDEGSDEQAGLSPSLRVLAQFSRDRRRRSRNRTPQVEADSGHLGKAVPTQAEAGEAGKAGTRTASNIPVPDTKAESSKADAQEPPEPDEWSAGEIIAALKTCLQRLAPLGADIEIAAPVKQEQCGDAAPVLLKRIGSGSNRVDFQPPPMLNCAMVASLHTWVEKTLQPAAQEALGTSIARLRGASGYACRNRNGSRTHGDRLSEHAHANAIDIMGFVTADGRNIDVLTKWGPTARDMREELEKVAQARAEAQRTAKEAANAAREAARQADKDAADAARAAANLPAAKRKEAKAEADRMKETARQKRKEAEEKEGVVRRLEPVRSAELSKAGLSKLGRGVDVPVMPDSGTKLSAEANFLRRLHKGACTAFGTVLGPEANEAHRNHFHFDLAARRRNNYCQ